MLLYHTEDRILRTNFLLNWSLINCSQTIMCYCEGRACCVHLFLLIYTFSLWIPLTIDAKLSFPSLVSSSRDALNSSTVDPDNLGHLARTPCKRRNALGVGRRLNGGGTRTSSPRYVIHIAVHENFHCTSLSS